MKFLIATFALLFVAASTQALNVPVLSVDFNSNQDGGGDSSTNSDPSLSTANHNQAGFSSYHANHEVIAEFSTANYSGITVTPDWTNTTDNRVRQSIDRGTGNDNNWVNTNNDLDLVTDWLGIDTRTGNGGNGNWDGGQVGTPTFMTLTLGGLSKGVYDMTSFHHDTENVHTFFQIEVSTDGGSTFTNLGQEFYMSDSTAGGNPNSATDGGLGTILGPDAFSLPSTVSLDFIANGTDDVVLRYAPLSGELGNAVHNQIWGINGFVLQQVVPEPATAALGLMGLAGLAMRRRRTA